MCVVVVAAVAVVAVGGGGMWVVGGGWWVVGGWAVVRVSAPPGGVGVGWAGRGDADRRVFAVAIVFVARVGASFMAVVQLLPPSDPPRQESLASQSG